MNPILKYLHCISHLTTAKKKRSRNSILDLCSLTSHGVWPHNLDRILHTDLKYQNAVVSFAGDSKMKE